MGPGLLGRAVRHGVRRLPGRVRRGGARLLGEAPVPAALRRALRRLVHGAAAVPPRSASGGYPGARDDPGYAAWVAQNSLTPEAAAAGAAGWPRSAAGPW